MNVVLGLLGVAVVLLAAGAIVLNTPPATLARWLRRTGPIALIGAGAILTLVGRGAIGVPLVVLGLGWLRRARAQSWTADPSGAGARTSTVRSRYLEMVLDHDTGDLGGTVIHGAEEGRRLDSFGKAELVGLSRTVADDPESLRLLEAYLDRRHPGWRGDADAGKGEGLGGAPGPGPMTEQQAYEILGLQPGATVAEIRDAHRRLMKRVHPDHGGTDFLAARINEAKALLIDGHR